MRYEVVRWPLVLVTALLILGMVTSAVADQYIKQASHTDAMEMMGQKMPARDDTTSLWLTEGKACFIGPEGKSFIYIAAEEKYYMVDHNAKTYAEIPIDLSDKMNQAAEDDEGMDSEQMKAMANQMMGSSKVTVTPTEETKKIGDWNARKYIVDMKVMMSDVKSEMWATEDIKIDHELLMAIANPKMAMMPDYGDILTEMMKIKGVIVASSSEMKAMGTSIKSTAETLEYAEKDAPEGTFEVPEGYKKVDIMQMDMGH